MSTTSYIHRTHPRSRSLKLSVSPDGQVIVTSPKQISKQEVKAFVAQNQAWIAKTKARISKQQQKNQTETHINIFGKTYQKELTRLETGSSKVEVVDTTFRCKINKHSSTTPDKLTTSFLKNTAQKYIIPRTHQLAKVMSLSFGKITLRQQKTRWGSCSSKGNLNFNWRLVHAPTQIIDYVIIHELAHLKHMNHSKSFWDLVTKYDPEYKKHRGWLKRNGMPVG